MSGGLAFGLSRHPDGSMRYRGVQVFRCACPDGCSLGWGYVEGMCRACYRTWDERGRPKPIARYRLPIPTDEPITWAEWDRMSNQARSAAKQRTKNGLPPLGAPSQKMFPTGGEA